MMKSDDDRTRIEWIYADVWSVLDPRKSAQIRFDPRANDFAGFCYQVLRRMGSYDT
jgi:hypothetical protein